MNLTTLYRQVPHGIRDRIADGIEHNRKNDAELCFVNAAGRPAEIAEFTASLDRHAFHFGCGAFPLCEVTEAEKTLFGKLCDEFFDLLVTPLVWGDYEPEPGQFRFAHGSPYRFRKPPADDALSFARAHRMLVKAHALMTHLSVPDYFPLEKEAGRALAKEHYRAIAERYDGIIDIFDGVNEPLCHTALRNSLPPFFHDGDYEEWNFREIAAAFRRSAIFANETFHPDAYCGRGSDYCRLLRKLTADPLCRIDGIGLYYHLHNTVEELTGNFTGFLSPGSLLERLDLYAGFGRPLQLSELSIPVLDGDEAVQAMLASELLPVFFSHPAVNAVIYWNVLQGLCQRGEERFDVGILHRDFSERPVCRVFRDLLKHEWHTEVRRKNCGGTIRFRGFCGTYRYTLRTADGILHTGGFELPEACGSSTMKQTIALRPALSFLGGDCCAGTAASGGHPVF